MSGVVSSSLSSDIIESSSLSTTANVVEKLAHTEIDVPGYAATCTNTGLTDGKKCSVCGEITVAQTQINKLAHTPGNAVPENVIFATCTN